MLADIYRTRFSLLTDLYQLTMAYGYWKAGMADIQTTFQLFFRKAPFHGGFAIAAGLEMALELIEQSGFEEEDITYLASLTGNDGEPLFEPAFLAYLKDLEFNVDIDAIPEGTVTLAHEPLIRITGPIIPCQLLETALLTCVNFQTLIATKAFRVCHAAHNDLVLEFGLRRAQGFDGAISATRAAYIGGVDATSNVLAGQLLDIPVKGTHAHAWVMMFDSEPEAFEAYARAMPNNCVFLVDTYDTIQGVKHAIQTAARLRDQGHEMLGIRLDSGDLVELSKQARVLLDDAGFSGAKIVASDSLNEYRIAEMKSAGSRIDIWGVGTNLVTAQDQPALGGVYKLSAQRQTSQQPWTPKIKMSNSPIKVSNPGQLQIVRHYDAHGQWLQDVMTESPAAVESATTLDGQPVSVTVSSTTTLLQEPYMRGGKRMKPSESLMQIRQRMQASIAAMPESLLAQHVDNPPLPYLDEKTWSIKEGLMQQHIGGQR